jgi:AcrR family transcriptional regulator
MDTCQRLIDERGVGGFSVEEVLSLTGVSKGSLYYHFEDFHDLIETTHLRRFSEMAEADIESMGFLMVGVTSKSELKERLALLTASISDPLRAAHRIERLVIAAGASHGSERFRDGFRVHQQRLQKGLEAVVEEAQSAGFCRSDLSPAAVASAISSFTFGRVISELGDVKISDDEQNYVSLTFIEAILGTD